MSISRRGGGSKVKFAEQFAARFPGGASVGRLLDSMLARIEGISLGLPRKHQETHLVTGDDRLKAPGTPATVGPNIAAAIGTGPSYALENHVHGTDDLLTTKGDSLTRNGSQYAREAVGANDTVLMADSAQATGRVWATIASIIGKLLTAKGDLLTHNGATAVRKAVGADALQLTAVAADGDGLRWGPLVVTPAQITGNVNDYAPGRANLYLLSSDASHNVTGLVAGTNGEMRHAINVGANDIVLTHQDAASAAANRFNCAGGASITLQPEDFLILLYETATNRWRIFDWL